MDKKEILDEFISYISKIPLGSKYISDNLRAGNIQLALNEILNLSEGINWLFSVEYILSEKGSNPYLNKQQLDNFLNLINEGLEKQDFVLVADIFEYEMMPYFEQILIRN